jgi:hypothetical protein
MKSPKTNCNDFSPVQASPPSPVTLAWCGNVIPFKNRKRSGLRNGKPTSYTEPRVKEHMETMTRSFEFQLLAIIQERATATGCSRQSLIASLLPVDDSLAWIPQIIVTAKHVKTGDEKMVVTIERLT